MAISLGDIKKKKITVSPIKNTNTNNATYNVAPPVNYQREKQTYNLGEIKNNNITVTPLSERPKSKILAPTPQETMTRNNINNIAIKNIVSGGLQNDIHNLNMSQATKINNTKIDLSGKDKSGGTTPFDLSEYIYNDTGKKYGDYYYDNYELYKDMPIYEQKGKYYLKTNRGYEPIGRLDKNGNVKTDIEFEKKDNSISKDKKFIKNQDVNLIGKYEEDKKELQKAEKLGYKDNLTKITTQDYDDAQEIFKKLQKEYKLSDKELNDWLKTGDLDLSHISLQTNSMSNLRNKAEDYREKINSGKIKQYDQQGFGIENQIYLDTQNLSDIEKQQYISYITGKKDKTQKNNNTFFKGSSVFDDGYQFGDVTKATLGTIGNAGISLAKGVGKFVEGTGDFATNLVGSGLELMASDKDKKDVKEFHNNTWNIGYKYGNKNYWYDDKNDRLYDENWNRVYNFDINKMQKRYTYSNGVAEFGRQMKEQTVNDDTSEVFDEILHGNDLKKMSVLGNKSEGMLESLGQAIPLMAAGGSVGGLYGESAAVATTSGLTFTSTYGKAKEEAIRNGATEKEAMQTAFVQATAETISEQFFDAIPGAKSAGWGEKLVGKIGKGVENYFGSTTGKIVMKALDISGEGFEEVISNMLTAGGNDIVHFFDKDYSYGMENQTGNILEDMKSAMVSQDSMDSFVSAIITSAILNGGSAKVNSAKINKIVKAYAQEYNMSFDEAKARLKISDDGIEFDTNNINQKQNTPNLPNNSAVQQRNINNNINNQVEENVQNNMPTIENNAQEKYSNVKPPMVIKYQATDNEKINSFRQSAVKEGMIDSKKTTNAMNVIEKVIEDKNYNVKFDRTITNLNGKSVDGKININKNGEVEIALNPNSDRAVEFLLTHEVTHAIETKELRGIILDYANKNSEFKLALQDLQKTYGTTNVSDEVIADISGQILGNQEFINSLSMQNTEQSRGFISKVYHSIQRLLNKLTTKGRYRNFVEDLETKWREAYRLATNGTAVNNLKNDSKYMMTSVKGMNNGINTDNKYLDIKKRYDKAQKLKNSGLYSNEDIRQETGWFQDKEGNWEFEISDHNTKFKIKPQPNTKYKMSNLFEATTLYDLYPGLKDINVIFKKLPKYKSGNYNMKKNEITINNNNLYNLKDIRGTLLHEMQHYIQKVEGLPRGTTILFGNEQYANSKGEIEAADTKRRMDMSVEERKQIIPESSKKNPIHPNRENILNHKRGIIEKIAEKMYNKFGVDTNENIEEEVKENYSKTDNKDFNAYKKHENGIEELDNSSFSFKEKSTYRGSHQIENAKTIVDLNINEIESKVVELNGYLTNQDQRDLNKLKKMLKSPNEKVKIYRASPVNELNNGDWVTTDKSYAKNIANTNGGKVYEYEVTPSQLWYPDNVKDLPSLHRLSSFQYNNNTKYSQESFTWQEHLDKNYKPTGTRTYFDEITNKKIAPINPNAIINQNKVKPPIAKEYQKNTIDEKIEKSNIPDVLKISGDNLIEQSSNLTNDDIAKILTEEPETENTKNKRKLAILGAQLLDKGLVFENLSLKTKNRDLMGKWDYTLTSEARGQNVIGNGHYEFDSETKTKKQTSKSLYDIQKEVNNSGNTKEFYEYLYHKHNIDRMSLKDKYGIDNKPVFGDNIDAEYSKNIVNEYEENYPQFTDYAQDVYDYLNADRQELIKSGVITQELADYWQEMYPHYVPIRREDTFGNAIDVPLDTKRTSVNAPIKKAKGGNQNILPLFDTIAKRTLQTYRAVAKNNFGIELKNTLNSSIDITDTNVDDVINNIDFQDELLTKGKNGSNPTFTVFENGKKVTFEITKDMYDALKPVSESSILSKTFKPFNKAMSIYRGILTEYNPVFMLTNSIKDAQDVLINSQHSSKTYKNIPEAYKQILSKGYWYQEYVSNGGEQNSYFDNWKNKFVKDEQNFLGRIVKWPFKKVSQANNVIEMAPRLAEYIASRQEGRSIETSMLDAARVTTNFKAGGDTTKFLNRNGGIFLNASVQGLVQNVRNVREARANGLKGWTNLATKCIIAGIPALILNNMVWDDDDDYNELADYVKDNYYIIAKYGDGKFIRIPKGRTIAVIQNAFTQVADSTTGNDKADLDRFLNLATSNLAPNNPIENNIFSPIIQVLSNKTWYGEDLVPQRLQSSPNKQQYDETTDSFSKWLGNKLNISPYKIHYLLDQYSGGVGDVVLPMMTPKAENGSDSIGGKVISPLIDKFTTDSVMNNKYVGDFYDVKDKATQKAHSIDATEKDILMSKYLNSKNFYLNQLYAEKRAIQNSKLKDSEKYKKVREKQDEINKLAKQSIDEYKKVKINGSSATVGDITYRKDKNGEWTKVKDK